MKNKVLASLENAFGDRCVDIFVRADGTYGIEEFRRDPEDGRLWQCLRKYGRLEFAAEEQALAAARERVEWLRSR